jgi:hypothetical protein
MLLNPPTEEQQDRIEEITAALENLCLGSVTHVVIEAAVNELLNNWDDHNQPN